MQNINSLKSIYTATFAVYLFKIIIALAVYYNLEIK